MNVRFERIKVSLLTLTVIEGGFFFLSRLIRNRLELPENLKCVELFERQRLSWFNSKSTRFVHKKKKKKKREWLNLALETKSYDRILPQKKHFAYRYVMVIIAKTIRIWKLHFWSFPFLFIIIIITNHCLYGKDFV